MTNTNKNQHFMPQFMLRGFEIRRKGRKLFWTYYFPKGREPGECSARNVGSENYFYQRGGDTRVDDALQAREDEFGSLVGRIRSTGQVPPDSGETLAGLVTSLSVRSRGLRISLSGLGQKMATAFERRYVDDPEGYLQILRLKYPPERLVVQALEQAGLRADALPPGKLTQAIQLAEEMYGSPEARLKLTEMGGAAVSAMREASSMERLKATHLNALLKEPIPEMRMQIARRLVWSLRRCPPKSLILGDVGPVRYQQSDGYASLFEISSERQTVFLPLSDQYLLVGALDAIADTVVDVEALNRATAELSCEFFIARQMTGREQSYFEVLARRSELLTDDELERIQRESFGDD